MIDVENEVFTKCATALRAAFPQGINVDSVTSYNPSSFPSAFIEESDNYTYNPTRDSKSEENHAIIVYDVNAYSNKTTGRKAECKKIIKIIDGVMNGLGFARNTKRPFNIDEGTKYRIFARYTAVISQDHTIYRR